MYSVGLCAVKFNGRYQIASASIEAEQWHSFNVEVLRKYTKRVMRQLLIILRELHARNFAHRFICPESIKWRWNTKSKPDIALCNLFLIEVQRIGSMLPEGRPTAPFTGPYFAPEFFYANGTVSTRADIYSAGVIFAELLLNDLPDMVIMRYVDRILPMAKVTDDPKWNLVNCKAQKMVKRMLVRPLLRKSVAELLESSYF